MEQIKNRFSNNKILIFLTSWGSILSAKLLERNPYAVDCVIACGQIVDKDNVDEIRDKVLSMIK